MKRETGRDPAWRRHQAAVRPKVRSRRLAEAGAALCVSALAAAAVLVVRDLPLEQVRLSLGARLFSSPKAAFETVRVQGAPEALRPSLEAVVSQGAGGLFGPHKAARLLRAEFPCLRRVSLRRDWLGGVLHYDVELRAPVAALERGGEGAGWLGEDGGAFKAPEGTFQAEGLPRVELGLRRAEGLEGLAQLLDALKGALPSAAARIAFMSDEEGWELWLQDGTRVLWGGLSWTDLKLARLREVLSDASPRFGAGMTADLRYFEDGRILIRPALRSPVPPRAGSTGSPALPHG